MTYDGDEEVLLLWCDQAIGKLRAKEEKILGAPLPPQVDMPTYVFRNMFAGHNTSKTMLCLNQKTMAWRAMSWRGDPRLAHVPPS